MRRFYFDNYGDGRVMIEHERFGLISMGELRRREQEENFWVDPYGQRREKRAYPYSYSEFYLWGGPKGKARSTNADYTDRLVGWDHEKFNRCCREHAPNKRWDQMTTKEVSAFLTAYYGRPIKATALAEGCNPSSGYPYWIIWYKDAERDPAADRDSAA